VDGGPGPSLRRVSLPAERPRPGPGPEGPPVRPVLPSAVRRLWRDRETLQLGRPPGPAAVV